MTEGLVVRRYTADQNVTDEAIQRSSIVAKGRLLKDDGSRTLMKRKRPDCEKMATKRPELVVKHSRRIGTE